MFAAEIWRRRIDGMRGWLPELQRELLGLPRPPHDDQADSVSQFLRWAVSIHGKRGTRPRVRRLEMKRRP